VRVGADCSLAEPQSVDLSQGSASPNATPPGDSSTSPNSASDQQVDSTGSSNSTTRTFSDSGSSRSADNGFQDDERNRLRLMHNYIAYTSKTVAEIVIPKEYDLHIWNTYVPELAFEHDYLLHGLLSLSALHLALQSKSRQENIILAIHHHDLGSALFRPLLSDMSAEYFGPIFAFSAITVLYSFGILRLTEPETNFIQKMCEVMTLTRGAGSVIKFDFSALRETRWNTVLFPQPFQLDQQISEAVVDMFASLNERISSVPLAQQETYQSTIQALDINIRAAIKYGDSNITLTLFPMLLSPDYWLLLRNGEYLALAIVANYAVILLWLRKNIWMEGWGKGTICAVREALPEDWHDCIAWAIREVEHE
jgi:hypothetical protein